MKQYTTRITAAGWSGTGFDYEQVLVVDKTTAPDWDRDEFIEWINDGKDFEDLQEIVDNRGEHDAKYTVTVYDDDDNITYSCSVWESEAAETALEV